MTTPMFSLVMPAYKRQFLATAIESVLNQNYADFELIVVDDASPEHLDEVVSLFHDPRLCYRRNVENLGGHDLVGNWNHCLQYAQGEFVVLATDDDVLAPAYLADAAAMLERYPQVDLVRQGVRKINQSGEPLEYELFPKPYLSAGEFAYFWGCCGLISCIPNFVFRRSALVAAGGFVSFPHAHYCDVATALALSAHGVACVQQWNVGFRMSDVNLSNRGDYRLALGQIAATGQFMDWLEQYLDGVEDGLDGHFYTTRAFQGFRNQYLRMMQNLVGKIPKRHLWNALSVIRTMKYAYLRERLRLSITYLLGI